MWIKFFKRDKIASLNEFFQTFNSGPSILAVPSGQQTFWVGDNGRKS